MDPNCVFPAVLPSIVVLPREYINPPVIPGIAPSIRKQSVIRFVSVRLPALDKTIISSGEIKVEFVILAPF